ncbi:MAG: Anti-sigma-B factor antagonist [Phycisphaerae bacterium]|nr:Anti-sigma-B factor antagonist [Phycisphaerae bacterium]
MSELITEIQALSPDITVVVLKGELNLRYQAPFHQQMLKLCNKPPAHLLLDLAALQHIDSSGVGTLVDIFRRVKKASARMTLVALSPMVHSVFEITKLDRFFEIYPTREDALKS